MQLEQILAANIPSLTPIEITASLNVQDETDRGKDQQTRLVYYLGAERSTHYDVLNYCESLLNGQPFNPEGIMLPIVDPITILRQ